MNNRKPRMGEEEEVQKKIEKQRKRARKRQEKSPPLLTRGNARHIKFVSFFKVYSI